MKTSTDRIFFEHQLSAIEDLVRDLEAVKLKAKNLPNHYFARHLLDCTILAFNDIGSELGVDIASGTASKTEIKTSRILSGLQQIPLDGNKR